MPIIIDGGGTTPLDYTGLKTAIANWMARTDSAFVDMIPDFIRLGEERIHYGDPIKGIPALRVDKMLLPVALTIQAGQNSAALPSDWLAFRTVKVPAYGRVIGIDYTSPENIDNLPACGDSTMYTVIGQLLVYGATVSADTPVTGYYYAKLPAIEASTTNWLLSDAPSVYLYSALMEGAMFLKNSQKVAEYGTLYEKAVTALQSVDKAGRISGGRLITVRA